MESGFTSVDPEALQAAAQRLDAVADLLAGVLACHLHGLRFDGDVGVRSALDDLVAAVERWQRTARDTATALRAGAQHYLDADAQAAESLR